MTDKLFLAPIHPNQLADFWPRVKHLADEAAANSGGKYKTVDVARLIIERKWQLWLIVAEEDEILAAAITTITVYPQRTVAQLLVATGKDPHRWVHLIEGIEKWAKAEGCTSLEPYCRPGWERLLAKRGFKKTHVVLAKDL